MAFRINKMPVLQEKSASGAVASFNTALAMPLVKCVVSFMATQSGEGRPSPYNERPITPVSSVDLSVNSVPVIVPLGDSYGGGTINLLTGKAVITYFYQTFDIDDYNYIQVLSDYTRRNYTLSQLAIRNDTQISNLFPFFYHTNPTSHFFADGNTLYTWLPNDVTEATIQVVYPIVTPIELTLTPTQIETLIGNNTIFADTGDIDLTYKDLDIAKRGNFREVFKLPS